MKKKYLMFGFVILCMISSALYSCRQADFYDTDGRIVEESVLEMEPFDLLDSDRVIEKQPEGFDDIVVYVCGCVKKPGVYTLQNQSRVTDAIEAAGGLSEDGDVTWMNLASLVNDGERIYVPSAEEVLEQKSLNTDVFNDEQTNNSVSGLVNVNTADKKILMTLPGIGESKADSIVKYRDEHGNFKTIEALKNVPGIKAGIFDKIKDLITIG